MPSKRRVRRLTQSEMAVAANLIERGYSVSRRGSHLLAVKGKRRWLVETANDLLLGPPKLRVVRNT